MINATFAESSDFGCGVFACNEIKATILVAIYFERRRKLHEYGK